MITTSGRVIQLAIISPFSLSPHAWRAVSALEHSILLTGQAQHRQSGSRVIDGICNLSPSPGGLRSVFCGSGKAQWPHLGFCYYEAELKLKAGRDIESSYQGDCEAAQGVKVPHKPDDPSSSLRAHDWKDRIGS